MPAIPSATETQRDFGLGLVSPASMMEIVMGVASSGTANVLNFFNDTSSLRDAYGEGPAVEHACNVLSQGGGPIGFIKSSASIAASNGSVTKSGSGPDITLSGSAALDAHLRVEIVAGGALGTGTFRYSCDGYSGDTASERTYSENLLIPSGGTFALPGLGITLTFAAGTYVAADSYTADVLCAASNATNMGDGFAPLKTSKVPWRFVTFVTSGGNGDATAHATLAAALQSQLATLAGLHKNRRGMIMAASDTTVTAASAVTAFGSTVASRVLVAFGMVRRTTIKPFAGYGFPVTTAIDVFAARAATSLPSTDLKRVKSGPLQEVVKLFHDEYHSPSALDDNKISTLRTYEHLDGYFVTQGRLKSPSGSDFKLWPMGLVIDIACETVNEIGSLQIGSGVRITEDPDATPGSIDERDAIAIEHAMNSALQARLLSPQNAEGTDGYVTDVRYTLDRTVNVLATGVIQGDVGILPLGYVDYVNTRIGFVVALPAAAAA